MSIENHNQDYKPNAHQEYTLFELGMWVHLLAKRATHRTDPEKKHKDLYDASNYLEMMRERLNNQ